METLAFDTSPLSQFARVGALDLLGRISDGSRRVITPTVLQELESGADVHQSIRPVLGVEWLERVRLDRILEIAAFGRFAQRLGATRRHVGEAETLAWAEVNQATAILDERVAVQAGRDRGLQVKGTLAIIAKGLVLELVDEARARELVDAMVAIGARFPCDGPGFIEWARERGLV